MTIESETSGFTSRCSACCRCTRNWELFARAGALFANNKIRIVVDAQGERVHSAAGQPTSPVPIPKGTTNFYAGLGISRRFLEIYDLRLEYQRAFDAGRRSHGRQGRLDTALLGLVVTF